MFDLIRKPLIWRAWDEGVDREIGTTGDFQLKSMQDLAVYLQLRHTAGKDIAEIGAGHSRVLPALAKTNRCVAVEKFEGEGGGPRKEKVLPSVENVSAYLGQNDPRLVTGSFDIVFSISVVEHVPTLEDLAAFHADLLRILKPRGVFLHAIDVYLEDEPAAHQVTRFEAYRDWVTSTESVEPIGTVHRGPCRFTCDLATNPDSTMYQWGRPAPGLIGLRQAAQCASLLVGGRKVNGRRALKDAVSRVRGEREPTRHKHRQSVLDRDGNELFSGQWDPRVLAGVLTQGDRTWWRGRRVLDLGANTGGLSLELARMGASVTSAEPDPFGNTIGLTRQLVMELVEQEDLDVRLSDADLFSSHDTERHDTILCLGLIYHFRYPQLILDYLSSLQPKWLFLSCQTYPSDELVLYNRANPGLLPAGYLPQDQVLAGWHPSRPALERMLQWAGFTDVTDLTAERYDFPKKPKGATNSAYYRAKMRQPVDPEQLKVTPAFYPAPEPSEPESTR